MNNIELGETTNTKVEADQKIFKTVDFLFTSYEKIKTDYIDSQESVGRLFNKVGNLLDRHGKIESCETLEISKRYPEKINNRTLNLEGSSYFYFLRIYEEEDRKKINVRIENRSNNYGSITFNLNKNNIMICSEIRSGKRYSFNEIGVNRINNLIDLIGEKKQKEKDEQLCQEAFFEEVNNLQFGKVFTELFKEKIDPEDRRLDLGKGKVFGKSSGSLIPFEIVLSCQNLPTFSINFETGEMKGKRKPLRMEILSCGKPILVFGTTEPFEHNQNKNGVDLNLWIKDGNFSLLPESKSSVFLDMIQDFKKKVLKYQKNVESSRVMEREGEGAGSR